MTDNEIREKESELLNLVITGQIDMAEYNKRWRDFRNNWVDETVKGKKKVSIKQVKKEEKKRSDNIHGAEFTVEVPKHQIPYKEQLWDVHERKLTYTVEIILNASRAHKIYTDVLGLGDAPEKIKVYDIVTHDKIPNFLTNIGYVVVQDGKVKTFLNEAQLKQHGIAIKITWARLTSAIKERMKKGQVAV